MREILVPVDGSDNAARAVKFVIEHACRYKEEPAIRLLNVQLPVASGNVRRFVGRSQLEKYYQDEGAAALLPARQLLDTAGLRYDSNISVGSDAETIVAYAKEKNCDIIVIGARGMDSLADMLLGAVATKVINLSPLPVLIVK